MKLKTYLRYFLVALNGAAYLAGASVEEKNLRVLAQPSPGRTFETRVAGPRATMTFLEKEEVTFLGVDTAPVSETLSSQLGLPKDSGLVLMNLVPESPAAAVLKRHDLLLKIDDQLLVDSRQFSVLVRNHKEGDEITLTYVRAGKTTTARIKLGKHEVPKMAAMPSDGFGPENHGLTFESSEGVRARAETDRVLNLIGRDPREGASSPGQRPSQVWVERREGPGLRATQINPGNSNMLFTDEQGSLDLTIKEGKKTLLAKNAKGEQVFSGPVNTPEERRALPPEIRERLNRLEGMQEFTFKTEEGFTPSKTVRPVPRGISLPLPRGDGKEFPPASQGF